MDELNLDDIDGAQSQQKYIKIKTIYLGVTASGAPVDSSLFNDVKIYSITMQEHVNEENLKHFVENADIVFLVADLIEDFVVKNILTMIEILVKHKKLFTTILAHVYSEGVYKSRILDEVRQQSSLLIVENQNDIHMDIDSTVKEKFIKIISELYGFIDEEIQEIRILDDYSSSLITMNRFFDQKCELYLYVDFKKKQFEEIPRIKPILEELYQIWIKHPFIKKDQVFNIKINDFIEFIEENIDEDADCFLSYKTSKNKNIDEIEFTVLISVPNAL